MDARLLGFPECEAVTLVALSQVDLWPNREMNQSKAKSLGASVGKIDTKDKPCVSPG
jgi:hypothetical protein